MDDYKMAIILPELKEKNISEGTCLFYGNDPNELHSSCLIDFCNTYYPENPIFQKLTVRHQPEIFGYFLQDLGNIIFFNTTSSFTDHGRRGMLILPDDITQKQKEVLTSFLEKIENYQITIFYHLTIQDGLLDGKELFSTTLEKPLDLFKKYCQVTDKPKFTK